MYPVERMLTHTMTINLRQSITGLYAITDPYLIPDERLIEACEAVLEGGCRLLQYRDKQASPQQKYNRASALRALCDRYNAVFIINDDIALAKQARADGVHLGQSDANITIARQALGNDAIIGITCHNDITLAQQAQNAGANYAAFGRFFPSKTKPHASSATLDVITQAKCALDIPIVAIGGITLDNVSQVVNHGADCVAVVEGLFASSNLVTRAQQWLTALR